MGIEYVRISVSISEYDIYNNFMSGQ